MSRVLDGNNANFLSYTGSTGQNGTATVLVWVKRSATATATECVWRYTNTPTHALAGSFPSSNQVSVRADQQFGNATVTTTGSISNSSWEPLIFKFNGNTDSVEIVGESTGTAFFGAFQADSSPSLYLGHNNSFTQPLDAKLAQVTVWSVVLSGADITALQGGADPSTIDSGNLIAHWPLDTASLTDTVGAKVLSISGTVANDDADNPISAAGPSITSTTDPAITGTAIATSGTGFGATQGAGGVTQEQGAVVVPLVESAWGDTIIFSTSADIESTGLKYGPQTLRVTVE